jgi:hypothetical protein
MFMQRTALATIVIVASNVANADTMLELRSSFIEQNKNRLTISCDYIVDAAHKKPNAPSKDGDMHIAGRCAEVGLNVVAEIQNAASQRAAVQIIHDVEGSGNTVAMTGVWRIWPEHAGDDDHVQQVGAGQAFDGTPQTNPPHVFEIHPVTKVNQFDLLSTLRMISGFEAKDASDAFQRYSSSAFEISKNGNDRVQMRMRMVGYNYVDFVMELTEREQTVDDGEFVFARIRDLENEILVRKLRVGFVKGSTPFNSEQAMSVGQCLRLLGIPRVDLALVSWRIENAPNRPEVLRWGMPYEIVAVGVRGRPFNCSDE